MLASPQKKQGVDALHKAVKRPQIETKSEVSEQWL
jgi:hypothetical protein